MTLLNALKLTSLKPQLAATMLVAGMATAQAAPLQVSHFNPGENSIFAVSSSFISGEHEMMLVDAQFQKNDAQTLVDTIKASGKKLTLVYISHSDPDFYFGLDVIKQNFPEVEIVATQTTVDDIKASMEGKLAYWGPILKDNAPSQLVLPKVVTTNRFSIDGEQVLIEGLEDAHPKHTFLWVPSAKTITGGVEVFDNTHVWMADTQSVESRKAWLTHLEKMEALSPKEVIPGHYLGDARFDKRAIDFTRDYINAFEKAAKTAKDSADLIAKMLKLYPQIPLDAGLEISAKVIMGEMRWPM
ncbi:MBL fold metallo-hydrolase [Shewanella xiamenensis]|uniref:MBL fold metallo-hydrolase n=1 Tax=Shewanella xiamenensis TaxID=332186 RepID=UPI000DB5E1E5|nr:MBL fold metallo-hydrolase [Shewanella xiamenensis]MCT8864620.1 MBL fold metallo-hydrolase [Shewanella xiamenensis]MCT8875256.1 MBL fold metallo-hydrolase [Shewanella xiamenensis]PZP30248.1 MAG: MBL fold metallo-hydrolase [Shewanella oneidensis]